MDLAYVKEFGLVGINFFTFLPFSAGNGKRINFLHNVWCGDHSLKEVCVTKIL